MPSDTDLVSLLLRTIPPIELLRIVDMAEAERLSSLDEDTLRRNYPELIMKLSKRRDGMRVGDALMLRDHNKVEHPNSALGCTDSRVLP
jgi:hypothetical protein